MCILPNQRHGENKTKKVSLVAVPNKEKKGY